MFDLLIVGAGTAGCSTAFFSAKKGLKVCLIDAKKFKDVGRKICGDAVGRHHFEKLGLPYPIDVSLGQVKGIKVYSPSRSTVFKVEGEGTSGFMLDRHKFGQKLLREALNVGVEFYDSTRAVKPIVKNGFVSGVEALHRGFKTSFEAKVTVDASGFPAVVRRMLPEGFLPEKNVRAVDVQIAYREIRRLEERYPEEDYGEIYLTSTYAPGGYVWIFPRRDGTVNVGLGVQGKPGHPNPRFLLYKFLQSEPGLEGEVLDAGGGLVPTRRPLGSLVADGLMLVGDSACQVNPIHGGGIGPSMVAGRIAAEAAASALELGDTSKAGLWSYNLAYMRGYGAKQAALDVFRRFLQELTDEEIEYGMAHKVVEEKDVLRASMYGNLRLSITEKAVRVFRSLGRLGFITKLRKTSRIIDEVRRLYEEFPETPDGFKEWFSKVKVFLPC